MELVALLALLLGLFVLHVLVHEGAHALACAVVGVRVSGIELFGPPVLSLGIVGLGLDPFGGGRVWTRDDPSPGHNLVIALAGPVAGLSLTVCAACFGPGFLWTVAGIVTTVLALDGSRSDFHSASLSVRRLRLRRRPVPELDAAFWMDLVSRSDALNETFLARQDTARAHMRDALSRALASAGDV